MDILSSVSHIFLKSIPTDLQYYSIQLWVSLWRKLDLVALWAVVHLIDLFERDSSITIAITKSNLNIAKDIDATYI